MNVPQCAWVRNRLYILTSRHMDTALAARLIGVLLCHQATILRIEHEGAPKEALGHQRKDAEDQEEPL